MKNNAFQIFEIEEKRSLILYYVWIKNHIEHAPVKIQCCWVKLHIILFSVNFNNWLQSKDIPIATVPLPEWAITKLIEDLGMAKFIPTAQCYIEGADGWNNGKC